MNRVLDGLIAQWRLCYGDDCRRKHCARCERGVDYCNRRGNQPQQQDTAE